MAAKHQVTGHASAGEGTNIVAARTIYTIFAIITTIILIRMVMLLMGSASEDPFVNFIYAASTIFIVPFFLLFSYTPTYGAPVFELSSVIALLVYILVGWGLSVLVMLGSWHTDEV